MCLAIVAPAMPLLARSRAQVQMISTAPELEVIRQMFSRCDTVHRKVADTLRKSALTHGVVIGVLPLEFDRARLGRILNDFPTHRAFCASDFDALKSFLPASTPTM